MNNNWREHIHSDPDILMGKPVVKGTRLSVEFILQLLENGWSIETILESYPSLSRKDLQAVFSYLKENMQDELYFPVNKAG